MKPKRSVITGEEMTGCGQHGFTLLETLVAIMILALSLVVIFHQFSGALNAGYISESYTRAVWHAREKMDELLLRESLMEEIRSGDFGDGYRWWFRIQPTASDGRRQPAAAAAFAILVRIEWQQGQKSKHLEIRTLTLAAPPDK